MICPICKAEKKPGEKHTRWLGDICLVTSCSPKSNQGVPPKIVVRSGVELIAQERQRQISKEGWTPEHDDRHVNRDLAWAARCYAIPHTDSSTQIHLDWPWANKWWKPSDDPIRNLVKAGALIAAEIDRLQRKESKRHSSDNAKWASGISEGD